MLLDFGVCKKNEKDAKLQCGILFMKKMRKMHNCTVGFCF